MRQGSSPSTLPQPVPYFDVIHSRAFESRCGGETDWKRSDLLLLFGLVLVWFVCCVSVKVFAQIVLGSSARSLEKLEKLFPVLCYGIPLVMAIIALVLDFRPYEDPDQPNAALVIIRDSFSCKPRLATFAEEMGLITGHFIFCGVTIVALIIGIVRQIITVQGKSKVRTPTLTRPRPRPHPHPTPTPPILSL